MRAVYLALLRAATAATVTGVRWLMSPPPPVWVDDGLCTCLECRCPWLAGDTSPSARPLPSALTDMEKELSR